MKDEPLLHPRQLYDLVLKYFFGDGHGFSLPVKNPHEKTATTIITKVRRSTIVQPFQTRNLGLKVFALNHEMFQGVGCFVTNIPQCVGLVTIAKAGNYLFH
jgi:hypothetical protein